jgi:hypothetical protein
VVQGVGAGCRERGVRNGTQVTVEGCIYTIDNISYVRGSQLALCRNSHVSDSVIIGDVTNSLHILDATFKTNIQEKTNVRLAWVDLPHRLTSHKLLQEPELNHFLWCVITDDSAEGAQI